MSDQKLNCWEFNNCGREPGGKNEKQRGVCPASINTKMDSLNSGKNGGRICWMVVGTKVACNLPKDLHKKFQECLNCAFYLKVQQEEGRLFNIFDDKYLRELVQSKA